MPKNANDIILALLVIIIILLVWIIALGAKYSELKHTVSFMFGKNGVQSLTKHFGYYSTLYYLALKRGDEYKDALTALYVSRATLGNLSFQELLTVLNEKKIFTKNWKEINLPKTSLKELNEKKDEFDKQQKLLQTYI